MVIVASADVPNWHANLRYLELLMVADSYKQQVMYEGFFPFLFSFDVLRTGFTWRH